MFSECSKYFAVSDDHMCVIVFELGHKYGDKSQPIEWVFKGKMRAHTLVINDICFGGNFGNCLPKLFSISWDMFMIEYQILEDQNQDK